MTVRGSQESRLKNQTEMLSPVLDLRLSRKNYESIDPVSAMISSRRESQSNGTFPRKLDISHNRLGSLPSSFYTFLSSVVELDVSDNRLKSITIGLSKLPNLKVLDARDNALSGVPEDFGQCASLEELNLGGNQLCDFPREVIDVPNLKELKLGDNKIAKIPMEIRKMKR